MKKLLYPAIATVLVSFNSLAQQPKDMKVVPFPKFDREAHRGGRGMMPENTIASMKYGIDMGAETIEMDTHITADGKVMISHDEYVNPLFSLTPDGKEIPKEDEKKYVMYQMKYADLAKFDVGSKYYPAFPDQKKMVAHMPLLGDLIDSVQAYLKKTGKRQVFYDIETKSTAAGDGTLNPDPETFVKKVMDVIISKGIVSYVIIQSFDKRTLQVLHEKYPLVRTMWLVSNKKTLAENLDDLGFAPYTFSPNYKMVTADMVKECHARGIKIHCWTVNTKAELEQMTALGVDGVISDYPNFYDSKGGFKDR